MFFTNIIQEDFANIEIFMLNSNPSPDRLPHNMKHKMGISNFVLYGFMIYPSISISKRQFK